MVPKKRKLAEAAQLVHTKTDKQTLHIWPLIEQILNREFDFDARICHPETFSTAAAHLDRIARGCLVKVLHVADTSNEKELSSRLFVKSGACGIFGFAETDIFCALPFNAILSWTTSDHSCWPINQM